MTYQYFIDCSGRPFGCDAVRWAEIMNEYASRGEPMKIAYHRRRHRSVIQGKILSAVAQGDKVLATFEPTPAGIKNINRPECWSNIPVKLS